MSDSETVGWLAAVAVLPRRAEQRRAEDESSSRVISESAAAVRCFNSLPSSTSGAGSGGGRKCNGGRTSSDSHSADDSAHLDVFSDQRGHGLKCGRLWRFSEPPTDGAGQTSLLDCARESEVQLEYLSPPLRKEGVHSSGGGGAGGSVSGADRVAGQATTERDVRSCWPLHRTDGPRAGDLLDEFG